MAFANRGYNRADEEDDDVAVSFHPGEFFFSALPLEGIILSRKR